MSDVDCVVRSRDRLGESPLWAGAERASSAPDPEHELAHDAAQLAEKTQGAVGEIGKR